MRRLLLLLLFTGLSLAGSVAHTLQPKAAVYAVQLRTDSSRISPGSFNQQKIRTYAAQKEFVYSDESPPNESLWSRFWRWFWRSIGEILGDKYTGPAFRYIAIIAAVVLIIYIIVKVTGMDLRLITSGSRAVSLPYSEFQENIHEIDFGGEINKAINTGNYRLAVRLFYLQTLKKLNDNNMISWQPEKTNQTYIAEIRDLVKQQQFIVLTARFEFIWYGEFFIDAEAFDHIKNAFEQFNPKES